MKFELNSLFHHGEKSGVLFLGFFTSKKFVPDWAKKEEEVALSLAQNLAAKWRIHELVIHTIKIVSVISTSGVMQSGFLGVWLIVMQKICLFVVVTAQSLYV